MRSWRGVCVCVGAAAAFACHAPPATYTSASTEQLQALISLQARVDTGACSQCYARGCMSLPTMPRARLHELARNATSADAGARPQCHVRSHMSSPSMYARGTLRAFGEGSSTPVFCSIHTRCSGSAWAVTDLQATGRALQFAATETTHLPARMSGGGAAMLNPSHL